jgi:hypothetical protein
MSWEDIPKTEFDEAYNQHLPKRWIKWAYKYFSKSTEKKDMKPSRVIVGILISLFLVGFFATAFKLPRVLIAWVTFGYVALLTVLVLFLFAAVFANNSRLKKVMKILGVNKVEYNKLADKYYP